MPCERYERALADAAASGAPTAEIEAHLAACASCRSELATLREALGLADAEMRTIALAEPSPVLRVRIRRAVAEDEAPTPLALRWLWPATAASLLLLAGAAGLWRFGATAPLPGIVAATPLPAAPSTSKPPAASGVAGGASHRVEADARTARIPVAPVRTPRPSRRPSAEPEVLVPPGQEEALLRFVAIVHREHLAPRSLMDAGEPSADLVEPSALQIQPLEIVPLDPAESSGT